MTVRWRSRVRSGGLSRLFRTIFLLKNKNRKPLNSSPYRESQREHILEVEQINNKGSFLSGGL